jgi:CheY-like chemotaxis protein
LPSEATVLVIDDEPAIERVLDAALRARGYDVHAAGTGGHGIELATALQPDVLIVDLGLPDIDGVEVCRRLRRTANPIIVLTVDDGENRKVEALGAGPTTTSPNRSRCRSCSLRAGRAPAGRRSVRWWIRRIEVGALRIDIPRTRCASTTA